MTGKWRASFRAAPPGYPTCTRTVHDRHCRIPWGYDPQHVDSDRPYTVGELATRQEGPHRFAYPDIDQYVQGWQLWQALRRDRRLTPNEQDARHKAVREHVSAALRSRMWR